MPKPYYPHRIQQHEESLKVVYFPSCINQTMGTAKDSPDQTPLIDKTVALLQKAGYEVIFPENMKNLCCGTIWESKGMMDIADRKSAELGSCAYTKPATEENILYSATKVPVCTVCARS